MALGEIEDTYVLLRKRNHGFSRVTFVQRQKIEKLLKEGKSGKEICKRLEISRSTLYYEKTRCSTQGLPYTAEVAEADANESQKVTRAARSQIPRIYRENLNNMYKKLMETKDCPMSSHVKEAYEECLGFLKSMGCDPNKMKKPVTIQEKEQILKLYNEGNSYGRISRIVGRSRSTVADHIRKCRESEGKTTTEITHEELASKWLN